MEAVLLLVEVAGFALVILWMGRRRGDAGLFAWRADPPPAAGPGRRVR